MTAMRIRSRAFARATLALFLLCIHSIKAADTGETLYNGIVLPREWPPHLSDFPTSVFKMWYLVGESASTGYATSRDGIHWDKPSLDVRPPTNIVERGGRDSSTVWFDLEEKDPARRFKMFRVIGAGEDPVTKGNNWQMAILEDLSSLANQPVRFRFHLRNGDLYSFWVSPEISGASLGYVAAGGPGFSSNRDL